MPLPTILVIDDDPDLCELIVDALGDNYTISTCDNGHNQAFDLVKELNPAIVILDVNLPNGNGLEICRDISYISANPPLTLLVSGDNSLELRLDAYNKGGADFLAKPFRIQELRAKIDALYKLFSQRQQLSKSSEFATQTAMSAMLEASQYGEVLRFYNNMYNSDSLVKIADCFFNLMASLGLNSSMQFRTSQTEELHCSEGECSPIEKQIYDNMSDSDRLISFSNRLMVNGTYASFIIKNMPVEDDVTNGRLRDILATIIDGIDGKLMDLQRLDLLRQTSEELSASTQRLSTFLKDHENFMTGAMSHVIGEIHSSFDTLEMTEAQEAFFTQLSEKLINSMEESFIHVGNETDILDCLRLSLSIVVQPKNT